MSQYYKPHRNPNWNYGGKNWKLSRSKIDLFKECPRCFYIDNKLGTARPPGYPFSLNSAVDHLLKQEFDTHRKEGTPHPLMEKYNIKAVPYDGDDIDIWRETFKGVRTHHQRTGFTISGAVDDVWINLKTKELFVVDYKATSKNEDITELDKDWHEGYKRQMEVYQWLLRQNDYNVSNTGYFVYANGIKDKEAFDGKLEFDITVIAYEGDDSWIEETLDNIKKTLDSNDIPKAGEDCDYCQYRNATVRVITENKSERNNKENKNENNTLF